MRTIKKTLKVKEVEAVIYDTVVKQERTVNLTVTEIEKEMKLPQDCVLISSKVIDEKEVVYKMSPLDFIKFATIEE